MSEIVAQTGKLDTLDIPIRDVKFGLLILKVFDQTTGQMGNTWGSVECAGNTRRGSWKRDLNSARTGYGLRQARPCNSCQAA